MMAALVKSRCWTDRGYRAAARDWLLSVEAVCKRALPMVQAEQSNRSAANARSAGVKARNEGLLPYALIAAISGPAPRMLIARFML